MKTKMIRWLFISLCFFSLLSLLYTIKPSETVHAQQPTGSIPTVTGTPTGPTAVAKTGMEETINVRNYPSTINSEIIGVIMQGQTVYVKGKTIGGDWLLINYPGVTGGEGWVWSLYMDVSGGELPVVEVPPTPAPKVTATIDPTLAAQFVITPNATSLPTFTQPASLTIPTFAASTASTGSIPVGLVVIILISLGALIGMLSIFQNK